MPTFYKLPTKPTFLTQSGKPKNTPKACYKLPTKPTMMKASVIMPKTAVQRQRDDLRLPTDKTNSLKISNPYVDGIHLSSDATLNFALADRGTLTDKKISSNSIEKSDLHKEFDESTVALDIIGLKVPEMIEHHAPSLGQVFEDAPRIKAFLKVGGRVYGVAAVGAIAVDVYRNGKVTPANGVDAIMSYVGAANPVAGVSWAGLNALSEALYHESAAGSIFTPRIVVDVSAPPPPAP